MIGGDGAVILYRKKLLVSGYEKKNRRYHIFVCFYIVIKNFKISLPGRICVVHTENNLYIEQIVLFAILTQSKVVTQTCLAFIET